MKERIMSNWTVLRAFYVLIGGSLMVHGVVQREWLGVLFGAYFASMGVFAYGCAAGNCGIDHRHNRSRHNTGITEVDYEEVK